MIVAGLGPDVLHAAATAWDCRLDNFRPVGKRYGFVLKTSRKDYMRRSPRFNRKVGPCFHIYREFVRLAFECGAALLITTRPGAGHAAMNGSKGRYTSWHDFSLDLEESYGDVCVGRDREGNDVRMVDLCSHGDCNTKED